MRSPAGSSGIIRRNPLDHLRELIEQPRVAFLVDALTKGAPVSLTIPDSNAPESACVVTGGNAVARVQAAHGAGEVAALLTELIQVRDAADARLSGIMSRLSEAAEHIAAADDPAVLQRVVAEQGGRLFGEARLELEVPGSGPLPGCFHGGRAGGIAGGVTGDALMQPVEMHGRTLGRMRLISTNGRGPDKGEAQLLKALAAQAAAPLENVRRHASLNAIMATIEELNSYEDVDTVLDALLWHARSLARADAGSIYLVEDGALRFRYVHNDTLFGEGMQTGEGKAAVYRSHSLAMDETSIVGYVATTCRTLAIDDAYALPPESPFSFNKSFDRKTGYATKSILTIPLKSFSGELLGVMQIINARNAEGRFAPFDRESMTHIPLFASKCTVILERSMMTRERILRMMKLAELRDPKETGSHVQRVGAYAAEIYRSWAEFRGVRPEERKRYGDLIRIAAMLHDVGKVGIADAILKKPGKLTEDEYEAMKMHPIYGAQVFHEAAPALDQMCYDIALHHHERYDGAGYPGRIKDVMQPAGPRGTPLAGEDIPLSARIVALADVYDALCSSRVYKEAWSDDEVLDLIMAERGAQFDPELVDSFLRIQDVVYAIRLKFCDDCKS